MLSVLVTGILRARTVRSMLKLTLRSLPARQNVNRISHWMEGRLCAKSGRSTVIPGGRMAIVIRELILPRGPHRRLPNMRQELRVSSRLTQVLVGHAGKASYSEKMENEAKSRMPTRVVAVLSAKDLAVVDEVAACANVSREEALKQLLLLELSRHKPSRTIH